MDRASRTGTRGAALALALLAVACLGQGDVDGRATPQATAPQTGVGAGTTATEAGWERIEPGGETRCARGGRYAFWAHRGRPDRLLVYFQGGGACFDFQSCAPGSSFFDDSVRSADGPWRVGGILDLEDPRNPLRDHTMLFIPYCTGDVHWGDARTTYRSGARRVTIEHRGFVNASAALAWAYREVVRPASVFVTGCSAGSMGSAAHAPFIIDRYRTARIAQLGDSLAFVFPRPVDLDDEYRAEKNLPIWARGLVDAKSFTIRAWYRALAGRHPDVAFAQFNFERDRVQRFFYERLGGQAGDFPQALRRTLRAIRREAPNFSTYTAPGDDHCVLAEPGFFTLRADGKALARWVADLAAGVSVPSVGAI